MADLSAPAAHLLAPTFAKGMEVEVHGVGRAAPQRLRALTLAVATLAAAGSFAPKAHAQSFGQMPNSADATTLDAAHTPAVALVSSPGSGGGIGLKSEKGSVADCVQDGLATARTTDPGGVTAAVCVEPDGKILGSMLTTIHHGAMIVHKLGAFVDHHREVDALGKAILGQPVLGIISSPDTKGGSANTISPTSAQDCEAQSVAVAKHTAPGKITTAVCFRPDGHMIGTLVAMGQDTQVHMQGTGVFCQDSDAIKALNSPSALKKNPAKVDDMAI